MPFTYSPTKYAVLSAVTAKDATVKLLAQQLGNTVRAKDIYITHLLKIILVSTIGLVGIVHLEYDV